MTKNVMEVAKLSTKAMMSVTRDATERRRSGDLTSKERSKPKSNKQMAIQPAMQANQK